MTDTTRLITSSEWLGIGVFSGIAYMVAKYGLKERSFDAESFEAEIGDTLICIKDDPNGYFKKGDRAKYLKFEDQIDRYYDLNDNYIGPLQYKVKLLHNKNEFVVTPEIVNRYWRVFNEAESFNAEDSRRRLKELMEGKSKEERKRISKMVQVRGLENTIAELLAHAEAFAATTFDEDDDDSPKINKEGWMPRTDCEICARPFTINRFGQQLIQHYLKESDNGEKDWKSKKNKDGARRTARNLAGFFLYEYGLDALNQYVLFQDKTGISDKVIELLRLSLVERVIAGDVVNLIEMMDMGDEVDGEPMFGKKFEDDFGSENN
tara:strand:- start:459 stop:1421 length:963 start_codon:yes stop_codon:yes gene_type:complete